MYKQLETLLENYGINFSKLSYKRNVVEILNQNISNTEFLLEKLFDKVFDDEKEIFAKELENSPTILITDYKVVLRNLYFLENTYNENVEEDLVNMYRVEKKFKLKKYFQYLSAFTINCKYFDNKVIYIGENYGFYTFMETPECMMIPINIIKKLDVYFLNTPFTFPEMVNILISGNNTIGKNINRNIKVIKEAYKYNIPITYKLFEEANLTVKSNGKSHEIC